MERRDALITGVVLCVFCLIVADIFVIARSDDDADVTLGADDAPSLPDPDDVDDPDELDAFVEEAIAFVEAVRGRGFVTDPVVVTLSEPTFVARVQSDLAADFAEDPEAVETADVSYRAAGLIGPDESIVDVFSRFGAAGILGFYDPETDELVVRQPDELSLLTRSTIVHELTHAFDDQHFDLDRPEYDDRTDEIAWGFRAVAEGSASWVEAQWEAELTPDEQDALLQEELSFGDPGIFTQFELSFLLLELSPYEFGEAFVEGLVASGGQDALDEALAEPPVTSEQVIDPQAYEDEEGAVPVAVPPADGEVLFAGLGGQVLIDSLFSGEGLTRSFEWGGDQMVVWSADGESCLRWDIQAESGDTSSVERDFEAWADRVGAAAVSTIDDRTVRVDRCV